MMEYHLALKRNEVLTRAAREHSLQSRGYVREAGHEVPHIV